MHQGLGAGLAWPHQDGACSSVVFGIRGGSLSGHTGGDDQHKIRPVGDPGAGRVVRAAPPPSRWSAIAKKFLSSAHKTPLQRIGKGVSDSVERSADGRRHVGRDVLSPEQLAESYRLHAAGLRAALRARLANEADVEDCLNRVFEKLWLHGAAVPEVSQRAWLFVVARNEAASLGRGLARRATRARDGLDWHMVVGPAIEPLDGLMTGEQLERLRQARGTLSVEQAEAVRLRFDEGLSFRQIAERLEIPLGSALSRVRGAILKMRKHFQ